MALDQPAAESLPGVINVIPLGVQNFNSSEAGHSDLAATFSVTQKEYLDGFLRGIIASRKPASSSNTLVTPSQTQTSLNNVSAHADGLSLGKKAQIDFINSGKRLCKEEKIKFESDPLDAWPRIAELSAADKLPEGEDLYRFKTHGLWNVSPAQSSMMCRLRIPGGVLKAYQAEAISQAAESYGSPFVDITTRANFQIREIPGKHMLSLLSDLHDAGIIPRGSGADNIRNVTGNPTCGIDVNEIYDVLPLCKQLHQHILHDRNMFGLPRKFNVAFDGGNSVSSLEDTNDIGLKAVRVEAAEGIEEGVYFRLALGGITGHGDLARDTGLLLKPEECIPVISAMIKVYVFNGDRSNRKCARLKYVLDSWGFIKFIDETQKLLPFQLRKLPEANCVFGAQVNKQGHLGIHSQRQSGLSYIGIDIPVGRLSAKQLRGLASIAKNLGLGTLRLTVWQNLILSDIKEANLADAVKQIADLGLTHEPNPIQAGLVACTGSEGCKFGMAPTKSTALAISDYLRGRFNLDKPVNIHLTGCAHSCAQHFIGDIGLIATSVETDFYKGPGFHFFIGGGYGLEGRMALPSRRFVPLPEVPMEVEKILITYLENRLPFESFCDFSSRLGKTLPSLMLGTSLVSAES